MTAARRRLIDRATAGKDVVAGLINAVVSVPDGLASAALAGVNPVYGLYASIAAPIAGSLLVSAQLMQVATTSASALAAGQAIGGQVGAERDQALFLLVVIIGLAQIAAGLLRLGRLTRFVAHSVMTGFLIGVAVVLVLDQLAPLVGFAPQGGSEVAQAIDLLTHIGQWDGRTLVVGLASLLIVVALNRTRLGSFGPLVALVGPALLIALLGWSSVQRVVDVSPIPRGLPTLALPSLSAFSPDLLGSALAIAVVILVQGAGVGQSFPNRDGSPISASRDFLAQGAANLASGLFRGIPVGGSVGQTALNVSIGAQTRLAGIMGGLWMLAIVALIPGLVGLAPMAALAALMILSGFGAIDLAEARSIWATGWASRLPLLATFAATLFLSIPAAVGIGVLLSIVLHLASASTDVRVRQLVAGGDGVEERPPSHQLPDGEVTVLGIDGSLFFAGARTLERLLPSPRGSARPAVVLRLRGRTRLGATMIDVLDDYAGQLDAAGGRLYLSGVEPDVAEQLRRSGKLGPVAVYAATSRLGESSRRAAGDARQWIGGRASDTRPDGDRQMMEEAR